MKHPLFKTGMRALKSSGKLKLFFLNFFVSGLLYSGVSAQPYDINAHDAFMSNHYVRHSIINYTYNNGAEGQIAVSNLVDDSNNPTNQFSVICYGDPVTPLTIDYSVPKMYTVQMHTTAKVVGVTKYDNTRICVTAFTQDGSMNKILYYFLDCSDFNTIPTITSTHEITAGSGSIHLFPMHSIAYQGKIYTCGFLQNINQTTNPTDIIWTDPRKSFVASLMPGDNTADAITWETPLWPTVSPSAGGYADHDFAIRLKEINGELIVMGSGNGYGSYVTGWSGGTVTVPVAWAWNSKIDPFLAATNPTSSKYYGETIAPMFYSSDNPHVGHFSTDITEDRDNPGQYYNLFKGIYLHASGIAHLEANLDISPSLTANSIYQFLPETPSGHTISPSSLASGTYVMHGTKPWSRHPSLPAYVVPFSTHFNLNWAAGTLTGTAASGFIHTNLSGNDVPYFGGYPLFNNTHPGYNSISEHPVSAVQTPNGDFTMMGVFNQNSLLKPRVIHTDPWGSTTCPGTQNMSAQELAGFQLMNINSQLQQFDMPLNTDIFDCNNNIPLGNISNDGYFNAICSIGGGSYYKNGITEIQSVAKVSGIHVYPVPVTDELTIETGAESAQNETTEILILDMTGKPISKKHSFSGAGVHKIDFRNLPSGVYFMQIFNGNNLLETKKVTKI